MAAPTGATLPLPSKTQDFHLIRPVYALGTFPSRGRLANAFLFLVMWFFDSVKFPLSYRQGELLYVCMFFPNLLPSFCQPTTVLSIAFL